MAHAVYGADRTLVMGVLNVTEDSFSDGGDHVTTAAALDHARALVAAGADIIDVGGESTRPGARRVDPDVERARVVPVIRELHAEGVTTSVDTMNAATAEAAAEAGTDLLNDVSGGLADPRMTGVAAETGLPLCLMHWEAFHAPDGAAAPDDIVAHVSRRLRAVVDRAVDAGVDPAALSVDLGLGFGKSARDNWRLLQGLPALVRLGLPVLVGASRKRFLTTLRPAPDGRPGTPASADDATAAVSAIAASRGAWAVRVHDVAPSRAAVDVARAVALGDGPEPPEGWRARRG